MRLLHTSDWHLGRSLHRADLAAAQAAFVEHLVATVRAERVDVVLISGDVYDRAVPPLGAVQLFQQALEQLADAGAQTVVISGNHDSPRRLGFGGRLFERGGVHLRTQFADAGRPVLLDDEHGPVAVYGVPYLDSAVVGPEPGAARTGPAEVLGRALAAVRADLTIRPGARSVVLAHSWVAGGAASESERDIGMVGGLGQVPVGHFAGLDYVALGHLHGPAVLADHLRYAGSPLPYSFSEAGHTKGSWLVELGPRGQRRVERVPAPVHRRLRTLTGELAALLTGTEFEAATDDFVGVTLTDSLQPAGAMEQLRRRFPHILTLAWEQPAGAEDSRSYRERTRGRTDLELGLGFVEHVRHVAARAAERALLAEAFAAVDRPAEPADPGDPLVELEVG